MTPARARHGLSSVSVNRSRGRPATCHGSPRRDCALPVLPVLPVGRELPRAAQPARERRQAADLSSADATAHFEAEPDHPRLRRQHRRPVARGPRTAPSSSTGAPGMAGKPPIGRGARCHPAALSSCTGVAGGVGTRRVRPSRPGSSMFAPPCSRQCRVVVAAQRIQTRTPTSTNEADGDGADEHNGSDKRFDGVDAWFDDQQGLSSASTTVDHPEAGRCGVFPRAAAGPLGTLVTGHGAWLTGWAATDPVSR